MINVAAHKLVQNFPPLLIAANHIAASVAQGVHGRRRVGQGEDFWQFRNWRQGDSPRLIDWRRSAKTDIDYGREAGLFVRQHEWAAAQSVWLWNCRNETMNWKSQTKLPTKAERAAILTMALGILLVRGGECIAFMAKDKNRPSRGDATLSRLLLNIESKNDEEIPPSIAVARNSNMLLMGDFLGEGKELAALLDAYKSMGIKGHLVQICDPAEEKLPFKGRVRFSSLNSNAEKMFGRTENIAADYNKTFLSHRAHIADIARKAGLSFNVHTTDKSPKAILAHLYNMLAGGE